MHIAHILQFHFHYSSDPILTLLMKGPKSFEGVEMGCIDSDLFDNVTLICTGTKPPEVILELIVTWFHDGDLCNGDVHSLNGGATVINTLRLDSSIADDSGNYTCIAKVIIPESTEVNQSTSSEVIFRSELIFLCISCKLAAYDDKLPTAWLGGFMYTTSVEPQPKMLITIKS